MMSLSVSQSQLVFPEESDTGGWWGRGSLSPERGEKTMVMVSVLLVVGKKEGLLQFAYM